MTDVSRNEIDKLVRPGDVLAGKYLVDRVLGVGGMGVVVAATHTQLDQKVAVKLLLPSMMGSREIVERFQREARAAAKIKSAHVVRVSDVGTLDSGAPFIVMELLEGRDLGAMLDRRGPLPVPLAVDYILEACEALAEAHSAGIVHRDLKPANLFLAKMADESDTIKVLDFGISKQITQDASLQSNPSLTKTTDVFGSPTYMSPEQLKASRDVDARADVWALGVILFELTSGKPPFGGGTVAEIFGAILHQPAPRLRDHRKDAPAELERVLLRCLEKDASKRFQSVADLAEALAPLGSAAARESSARVSRILRAGAVSRRSGAGLPRASMPSGHDATELSLDGSPGITSPRSGAENVGGATNTTWSHIQPTGRASSGKRTALIALAVALAAAGGAFVSLQILGGGASSGASGAASPVPSSETSVVPPAQTPMTVVIPAPTETATAAPSGAPSGAPAASSATKPTGRAPGPLNTPAGTTGKPPASTTTATSKPPAGDDDFGGRK